MFHHVTVMKEEAVHWLNIKPEGIYVDCTLGGGGHSEAIAERLGGAGKLIALDQDETAIVHAAERLATYKDRVTIVKSNFRRLEAVLEGLGITKVDGVLYDLGVSSPQLDNEERGFSYQADAPLDMRMDREQDLTAYEIVNHYEENELADIIYRYGEERFSRAIAKAIVKQRKAYPIETTGQLAELIKAAIPAPARRSGPHPAKRTFQAIRIAVNDELQAFRDSLRAAVSLLKPQGRLVVISFHSLEDRICKNAFKEALNRCTCPPDLPVCVCGNKASIHILTKKPIEASQKEIKANPRARSAKLRAAEKI